MYRDVSSILHKQATAVAILCASLVLTYFGWKISSDAVHAKAIETFQFDSEELVKDIEHRLVIYEQVLIAGRAFVKTDGGLDRKRWRSFVLDQNIQSAFPGIQGIGFAKFVSRKEKRSLEKRISEETGKEFNIRPAGDREWYTSIIALEPFDWRNQRAFGFDMYSEATRHEAMERSLAENRTSMSGMVKLVQETESNVQNGFLVYVPYFTKNVDNLSFNERILFLDGFVYAPFRIYDFLKGVSNDIDPRIAYQIYDRQIAENSLMLTSSNYDAEKINKNIIFEKKLVFGGHEWIIKTAVTDEFLKEQDSLLPYVIAVFGVFIDILLFYVIFSMDRLKRFQMLKITAESAESANRAKTDFLSNVSHEIRTPMNGILGMCEIMSDSGLDSDQKEGLRVIQDSAQSLMKLIEEILDFSSIESGKIQLEKGSIYLKSFLEDQIHLLSVSAYKKGLALSLKLDSRLPKYILEDREKLKQVLINIVGNAIKFTESGFVELKVTRTDDAKIRFDIIDTGIGIKKNHIRKIFKAFVQGDESTKRIYGGTGLGLYISKRVIQLMGGTLNYKPGENSKGSHFYFDLPLVESFVVADSEAVKDSGRPNITSYQDKNILVVDDNQLNRLIILKYLEKMGFKKIDQVETGMEALVKAKYSQYDLVLLDCQMPNIDGYETSIRLREANFKGPIVAITANALADVADKCQMAGMNDMLTKPIEFGLFKDKIASFLMR